MDCFYLPSGEGLEAEGLYEEARRLLALPPGDWGAAASTGFQQRATRLRDTCARLAELRDRRLFHALSRFAWDLREELDLLLTYLRTRGEDPASPVAGRSDFHLPGTYRGGLVARFQRLLVPHPDGTFTPAPAQTHDGL
jgi:hypothetical protein